MMTSAVLRLQMWFLSVLCHIQENCEATVASGAIYIQFIKHNYIQLSELLFTCTSINQSINQSINSIYLYMIIWKYSVADVVQVKLGEEAGDSSEVSGQYVHSLHLMSVMSSISGAVFLAEKHILFVPSFSVSCSSGTSTPSSSSR